MEATFFEDASALRKWFVANHATATELLVGYYKVGTGRLSITWSESVDQALCFGWIDGVRRSIDAASYSIRFTPRKAGSNWSLINVEKVAALTKKGLMKPAGLAAFEKRQDTKTGVYSFERKPLLLDSKLQRLFKANKTAWERFQAMAPSYRKTAIHWVMSAKKDETRLSRMNNLINDSASGTRVKPLRERKGKS